jgi:hypothetical protein
MGLMDHRKTWRFELAASPNSCVAAFATALDGKSALSTRKARWDIAHRKSDAGLPAVVATYRGRDGLAEFMLTLTGRHIAADEEAARGSQIAFEVEAHDSRSNRTTCAMWLGRRGVRLVDFTAQAGFFRSYMRDVASELTKLDPTVALTKV